MFLLILFQSIAFVVIFVSAAKQVEDSKHVSSDEIQKILLTYVKMGEMFIENSNETYGKINIIRREMGEKLAQLNPQSIDYDNRSREIKRDADQKVEMVMKEDGDSFSHLKQLHDRLRERTGFS